MINFFIVKTFCTDDKANMTIFTGDQSPAKDVPEFVQKYVLYANNQNLDKDKDKDKDKYIFNNKLLSYEYKNIQNN